MNKGLRLHKITLPLCFLALEGITDLMNKGLRLIGEADAREKLSQEKESPT